MKKFLLFMFLAVLVVAGLMENNTNENKGGLNKVGQMNAEEMNKEIEKLVDSMTIEEKIGQMVMMGIEGDALSEDAKFLLTDYHIGGVILFDRNMKNPEQVKALTDELKDTAGDKVPLLIATDEEGGVSARLKDYIAPPSAAKVLGDAGNPETAYNEMKNVSEKFKELGFNMNFAPVADLNLPDNRFYSADPTVAANFVKEAAAGVYDGGLIPCVKHFPGFATVQYQNGLPFASRPKTELLGKDLYPYERLKDAEFPYFIMVNNAVYQDIDKYPASLSKNVIRKILRDELKFQGVVITDDLSAGAIPRYKPAEKALRAIEAGADMVLSCNKYEDTREMYLGLLDAYNNEKISLSRVNESVKRILKAKMRVK